MKENKYQILDNEISLSIRTVAKYAVNTFHRLYYGILLNIVKPNKEFNTIYDVSICAIFKDEADYLKEWIEYHKIVGVDHFYLYNNLSNDNYYEALKPYVDSGDVTLIDWEIKQGQMQAYQHWADNYKNESKWVGFIDLDEFVVPNKMSNIYDFLKKFDNNRPVVIMPWRYFGTSGLIDRDLKGLVTEDFTVGWYKYSDIGKYFFNTKYDYIQKYKWNRKMHSMWAGCKGIMLPPVNVFDKVCSCGINPVNTDEMPIQINHYLLKSYNEYMTKKIIRGGGDPEGTHDDEYFKYHEKYSTKIDNNILKYIDELKKRMK